MKIKNRQQFLAILTIAALALLISDRLLIRPLSRLWKDRSARITQLRKSVAQGSYLVQREQALRDRWGSMRTNTLPDNVSAAETLVFRAFDRWSQDARISISSIKPQWKRVEEEYMTLEYRADAVGSMQSLTRFLYNVEKDPLGLRVEAVEITARDNEGQQLALAIQVSGLLLNRQQR